MDVLTCDGGLVGLRVYRILEDPPTYMEWSTSGDKPRTHGMTWDEFGSYYMSQYGRRGLEELSMPFGIRTDLSDLDWNRAGPHEICLTIQEIIDVYVHRLPVRGWILTDQWKWIAIDTRLAMLTLMWSYHPLEDI